MLNVPTHRINRIGLVIIHVGALAAFVPALFHWQSLAAAAGIYILTGALGVTLCFHRTLTHRSARLRKPVEYALAVLGTLAFQGDPIRWVATHRKHHAHADDEGDPHSVRRGFGWAHAQWIYRRNESIPTEPDIQRYAADLNREPFYRALRLLSLPLQLALGIGLFFIGGWSLVVWGIFARLVFSYHSTWLVNSAAHTLGYRSFRTNDLSTNCWWVALISFGEGWHNNHHACPYSARHGLRWFEIDTTWWTLRAMKLIGRADRLKVPDARSIAKLRLSPGKPIAE